MEGGIGRVKERKKGEREGGMEDGMECNRERVREREESIMHVSIILTLKELLPLAW